MLKQNTHSVSRPTQEALLFDRHGRRKYLSRSERSAFLKIAQVCAGPICAFQLVLFYTGCRISEALNLTEQRVDPSSGNLVFETLKRRKRGHFRSVPVPKSLALSLVRIGGHCSPTERIWMFSRTTAYRIVKATMREASISGAMASPKGLRHSFAMACIAQNIPLPTIRKWLGHARIETTAIYLEAVGEEERALAKRLW